MWIVASPVPPISLHLALAPSWFFMASTNWTQGPGVAVFTPGRRAQPGPGRKDRGKDQLE